MNITIVFIKKIFDYFVWMAFFGFLLLGVIIYVTNITYPGDRLYPFKLKFEEFALITSKILNKQVDFSIDLVSKRSYEVAKILSPKNSEETLSRLDSQIESTAVSIIQISDPIEKKKAATKYITKLSEVSSVLIEKEKEFVVSLPSSEPIEQQSQANPTQPVKQVSLNQMPKPSPLPEIIPETKPEISVISKQIDDTQATIQQTIDEMNVIVNQPTIQKIPTPINNPELEEREREEKKNEKDKENEKNKEKDKDGDKKGDEKEKL